MNKLEKQIFKKRLRHPNCMYCEYLNGNRFFYFCEKTKVKFLFNNICRAKKCKEYFPKVKDLKLAVQAKKELNL